MSALSWLKQGIESHILRAGLGNLNKSIQLQGFHAHFNLSDCQIDVIIISRSIEKKYLDNEIEIKVIS